MRGRQRVNRCYARLLEARSGRGQKTTSRSCFHRKCLPSSWVRADAVSLPHLSSPLPVPLRVLVPGWCFLVAAAAVSMCDGPQGVRGRGAPCPPSASPLGCGTSACLFAGLRVPVFPSLVAGLVSWPLSRALPPRDSADPLWCPLLSAAPRPEAVVQKWLSAHGLGGEWRFCLLYLHNPQRCLF